MIGAAPYHLRPAMAMTGAVRRRISDRIFGRPASTGAEDDLERFGG